MLPAGSLLPFLLAVALIELTPGPNMGYLALVASRHGRLAGFVTIAGVSLGLAVYLAATIIGLADLVQRWPAAYAAMRWGGVAYLLWLAFDAWRDDPGVAKPAELRNDRLFLRGLTTNLLNPKAALFYVTVLPAFVDARSARPALQVLTLGAIHLAVSLMVHSAIVLAAAGARPALRRWRSGRPDLVQKGMAIGLAGLALWLAFSTRGQ